MGNLLQKSKGIFKSVARHEKSFQTNSKKVVVITGCDSGLGFSLSLKCNRLGLTVVSGCLDLTSEGAKRLSPHCHVYNLDVTDINSVTSFYGEVEVLTNTKNCELLAVVNNAGVLIFGEFEWFTKHQITQQIEVNLLGCFRMAKVFLPMLRKHKGRLINITSHCALHNLPSLSVYGATKAAIQSWSEGLRLEQKKYGVKIISFIPGSFASQSNIMATQEKQFEEMEKSFSAEDEEFYGEYFREFTSYLRHVSGDNKPLVPLKDEKLYEKFTEAILSDKPKAVYKHEPWRYFFYYNAFRITPIWIQEYLVRTFLKFPQYKAK